MDLITLTIVAAVVWVGYRVVDKGNLFLGLSTLKEDVKDLGAHSKEGLKTGTRALEASKAEAKLALIKEQLSYEEQGLKWESEDFARKRARVQMVQEIYRPTQKGLEDKAVQAREEASKLEQQLAALEAAQ